jgi:hypothetical protein
MKRKVNFMLLKNKIYSSIIIIIFIVCLIIGLNENIIGNPIGEKIFYLLGLLFFVLLIIGTIKKRRH